MRLGTRDETEREQRIEVFVFHTILQCDSLNSFSGDRNTGNLARTRGELAQVVFVLAHGETDILGGGFFKARGRDLRRDDWCVGSLDLWGFLN